MTRLLLLTVLLPLASACSPSVAPTSATASAATASQVPTAYFDQAGRDDVLSGGVHLIEITTPKGPFRVWTKRIGNNPKLKVLILHGGPGFTHEAYEAFDSYFPGAGIEYYYYDQLGSAYSDQPHDASLWDLDRFVDEVEQVRTALKLDRDTFVLYGHSWGGLLAMEYALKHPEHLKGLVISNMMSSIPAYNAYAHQVLMPQMNPAVLKEILALEAKKDYGNPRYEELLMGNFYTEHILRMPLAQWPDPLMRSLTRLNREVYVPMQGPSEMGASGKLENWDRSADLKDIRVPTLVIGARHDSMDPRHMEWMARQIPGARYLDCANGSHFALYDDQKTYMDGLIGFLKDVEAGKR
ncbi:MAG: proline iminopeptidase-family hydrolase [Gammaproteobacteria bacterium]|nr:proline iminopeptidase-family hydrolase [Gammaproteobacteria bacterium]